MNKLPLLFLFNNTVQGNGFQAHVTAQGRALVERGAEEEGEVWVTGVQPGGIAEGATDEQQAYKKFRRLYQDVLLDVADEAEDFEVFTVRVQDFFKEICTTSEALWWEAVQHVREEGYAEESLKKKPAGTPVGVTVERVEQPALEHHPASEDVQQELSFAA